MTEFRNDAHDFAMKTASASFPPLGDIVTHSIAAFFLASFPGYCMLLFFGFRQESVEIPMIIAGCIGVGIVHLLHWERTRNWRKCYEVNYLLASRKE